MPQQLKFAKNDAAQEGHMVWAQWLQCLWRRCRPWKVNCVGCGRLASKWACAPCQAQWRQSPRRGWVAGAPAWHAPALAWQAHQGFARALVHRLKWKGQIQAAWALAEGMAPLVPPGPWLIVPIPSSWWRSARRGHWPAARLANAVAKIRQLPCSFWALRRSKQRFSQIGSSKQARLHSELQFGPSLAAHRVCGQRVLLVDDVLATGATARAAAQSLMAMGAQEVLLLVATQAGGHALNSAPQGFKTALRRPSLPK